MQKRHSIKARKYITPIVLAGSIITSNLQQVLVEKLIAISIEIPDPHLEESYNSEYFGLNRVNGLFSATGTNPVVVFGGNNSSEMIIE